MIVVDALTKHYGETVAVDDLSFTVRPGIVTGFLGPNGAGKSTMRMILGLDRPTGGTATVNGRPLSEHPAPLTEIGFLLDAGAVHKRRSARNHLRALAASNGIGDARVDNVVEIVGLADVADRLSGSFSLGMGQRLGIASALLGDILAVADHAAVARFTHVGHSLGGTIGDLAASREPDRVERLVLVCPGPAGPPRAGRAVFSPFRAAWERGHVAELTRLLALPYAVDPGADVLAQRGRDAAAVAAGHVDDLLASAEPFDVRAELASIECPTLVVTADCDGPFRAVLDDFRMLSAASLHVFSGVGHVPQQECPGELAAVLQRFLASTA